MAPEITFGFVGGGAIHALTGRYYAQSGFNPVEGKMPLDLAYNAGRLLVAGGHIGLVMLILKSGLLKRLTSRLAAVR